jgi:hypothetical protein
MNQELVTEEEMVRRIEEAAAEDVFPGVLGNPVTFAARYGLPLSKSYLAYLDERKRKTNASRRRKTIRRPSPKS